MADIKQIILPDGNTYNLKDTVSTWVGTQDEYDAIQNPDPTVTYFITDGSVEPIPATNIEYDNSLSGLSATQVQSAIDEVNNKTASKADKALSAFNLTAGTGMTLQYVNCFAFGNLKVISANIIVGSGATTTIATVPSAYSALTYTFFYLGKNGGNGAYGYMAGTSLKTDNVLSTGNYTINFVYR